MNKKDIGVFCFLLFSFIICVIFGGMIFLETEISLFKKLLFCSLIGLGFGFFVSYFLLKQL